MTDTENQERIAQVRARLSAATPGPWHAPSLADGVRHLERNCSEWYGAELPEGFTVPGRQNGDGGQRDGEFIANAPTDVAFLLSRVDSLESALREAQKDAEREGWTPVKWRAPGCKADDRDAVFIEPMVQRDGSTLYAIRDSSRGVMARDGIWEYEPTPSSRDDAFIARCRFASFEEAARVYANAPDYDAARADTGEST